jgi:hypothetical protein
LTNTHNQCFPDYAGPDVELVVSPVNNAVAHTFFTCLQLPTPDALTRSGDSGGTFNGAFRGFFVPGPTLTYWRFADLLHILHEGAFGYGSRDFGSLFRFTCVYFEGTIRLLCDGCALGAWPHCGACLSCSRKCHRSNWAPLEFRGFRSSPTVLGTSMSGERSTTAMLMDRIPRCPCS